MIEAPVGFQCPGCVAAAAAKTRRPAWKRIAAASRATVVLVGINVAVWLTILLTGGDGSPVASLLGLNLPSLCNVPDGAYVGVPEAACAAAGGFYSPGVAQFALWKLLTSGFTHLSIIHLGFNMVMLWLVGPQLDRYLGTAKFVGMYLVAILFGSAFSLWLSAENAFGVGASGGLWGMLAALLVISVLRGGDVRQILIWIGINVAFTVWGAGTISWQAHLGGFVGGGLATYALLSLQSRPARDSHVVLAVLAAVSVVAATARVFVA